MPDFAHIFISYAREDGLTLAERLDNDLQAHNKATWRDKRNLDPNQDFTAELEKAIEAASHVVVCLTPDTKRENSFVRREIGYALAMNKRIIPLIFDNVVPPIHIVNLTRIDFHRQAWTLAFAELMLRLDQPATVYEQATPPPDPFRDYLNQRYQEIINYLDSTVFSLIALHTQSAPGQVQEVRRSLPIGFSGLSVKPVKPAEAEKPIGFNTFPDAFEHYGGRVLLLGEPGAGKTTTLMAFARDAIARRLENPAQPLPLLAAISTWKAETAPSLADWLLEQSGGLDLPRLSELLSEGKTLLLLDALDELGSERENANKEKYDPRLQFMAMLPTNNRVLVSSRVRDYAEIGQKIALNGAITLQPLDDTQMQEYLRDYPDLWQAVQNDSSLREMAGTPLLLSLFTFAFQGMGNKAAELRNLQNSPGDLRDMIFKTYVEQRFQHEKVKLNASIPFELDQLVDLLAGLAVRNAGFASSTVNVVKQHDLVSIVPSAQIDSFTEFATRLHLLTTTARDSRGKTAYRFIHLLLRDYFIASYCFPHLQEARLYKSFVNPATVLGSIRDKRAIPLLINGLKDKNPDIRASSVIGLGRMGDPVAITDLIDSLENSGSKICDLVVDALARIGTEAVNPSITALASPIANVRSYAASALGKIGDNQAIPPLINMLSDPDAEVGVSAATALAGIGKPALEPLLAVLGHPIARVRTHASLALGHLRDKRAVQPLLNYLYDDNLQVRQAVIRALGLIRDNHAIEPLIQLLGDGEVAVRSDVAEALGDIRDKNAVQPLIRLLNDAEKTVRSKAVEALGDIGDEQAVQPLIDKLYKEDRNMGRTIAVALSRFDTVQAKLTVKTYWMGDNNYDDP